MVGEYPHPFSLNVIGGISRRGKTRLFLFSGNLETHGFLQLIVPIVIPFVLQNYPNSYRLHMDNARCHVSRITKRFFTRNSINHFKTPAQSPDLNPIELVWHDLKDYLSKIIEPTNKEELINGIIKFWREKVTVVYCNSKIDHLNRVLDTIIVNKGKATGL